MKEKIRSQLLKISFIAIIITLIISVGVFYELFKRQVLTDLKAYADVVSYSENYEQMESNGSFSGMASLGIRITIVNSDGSVEFDSEAEFEIMENHEDRPEIKNARSQGEGYSIRTSKTVGKSTFYYACLQSDGRVIRVARNASNIWMIFLSAIPVIFAFTLILFIACFIWSKYLTRKLVTPIEALVPNINNPSIEPEYKELVPFVDALKEQHADILRNATMRQEFTANVSHELKTPLTSISGYAELIETGIASGEEGKRFAGEIKKNASRLLNLINDIINLSELDSDHMKLQLEKIDLYSLAKNCVKNLQVNAEKHEVDLMILGSSSMVLADKGMMEEVLYNLCDNAIRYNNKGGKVFVDVSSTNDKKVNLVVKDTGIGIPKEHQERIFERFYRVDKSRSKETGGTGLGLAIVKHILTQHGAELKLESKAGEGTCITVSFNEA